MAVNFDQKARRKPLDSDSWISR